MNVLPEGSVALPAKTLVEGATSVWTRQPRVVCPRSRRAALWAEALG